MQLIRILSIFYCLLMFTSNTFSQCNSCTPANTYSANAAITATANNQTFCITGGTSFSFSSNFRNVRVNVCAPGVTFSSVNISSSGFNNTIETWGENTTLSGLTVGADTFSFITNEQGARVAGAPNLNRMAHFHAKEHATLEIVNNLNPGRPVFFTLDQHATVNTASITSNEGGAIIVGGGAEFNSSGQVILQKNGRLFNTGTVTVAGDMTVQGGANAMNNYCGTATIDIGGTFIINTGSISNSGTITTKDLSINSDAGPIYPHKGSMIDVTNKMLTNNTANVFRGDSIEAGECATFKVNAYDNAWNHNLTNSNKIYYCGPTPPSGRAGSATLSCDCNSQAEECLIICEKPEAGSDGITCTPEGVIDLNNATGYQRWFTHPSNPSNATISLHTGEVSGMNNPGIYQFILRDTLGSENETCLDTVSITVNKLPSEVLTIRGRVFCSTEETTRVTIENAEPNVTYSAYLDEDLLGSNINTVNSPTTIDISVPTENLQNGMNVIHVRAEIDGCSSVSLTDTAGLVKVPNPDKDVEITGGIVCSNETSATLTIHNAEPDVTYTAYRGSTELASGSTSSTENLIINIPVELLNNGDNSISTIAHINGCSTVAMEDTVVIKKVPNPSATLTIEGNIVCSNESNTTIVIRNAASGVTYSAYLEDLEVGTAINNSSSSTNLPITIPTNALSHGTNLLSIRADIDGCATVNLNNKAELLLVPQPANDLEVEGALVCSNQSEAMVSILNSNPGVTYTAYINGAPAGTATNSESTEEDITIAIPMSRLETGINIISFRANINGCTTVELLNTAEVIRIPNPSIDLTVNGNILCSSDGSSTYVTVVNTQPGVTYSALLGGKIIGSNTNSNSTAENLTISIPVEELENGDNTITIQADINGCATRTLTNRPVVTLDPALNPGSIEAYNNIICSGTSPQLLNKELPTGGLNPLTYSWQYSFNETDWNTISGSNTPGPLNSAPSVSEDNVYYRRRVTSKVCTAITDSYHIQTTGQMDGGGIEATSPEVCKDADPAIISSTSPASGGTGSGIQYQWQISLNGSSWTNIPGAEGIDYEPEPMDSDTWFRRRATNGEGECDTTYAGPIQIELYEPLQSGNIQSGDTTVCMGSDVTIRNQEAPTGGSPGYNYIWQRATEPYTTWSDIADSDGLNVTVEDIQEDTRFRRIVINDCDSDTTDYYEVKVLPNLITQASFATVPSVICSADELTFTVSTENAGPNRRIDWYYNDAQFLLPSGQPDSIYTKTGNFEDGDKINVIVYADPNKLCTTPSATDEVVLDVHYALDENTLTSSNQTACEVTDLNIILGSDASGSLATPGYIWQISYKEDEWEDIPGANERDYLPEITVGDVLYRRIAVSEGACANDTTNSSVRVKLDGEFNPGTITADPANICQGTIPTFTVTQPQGGLRPYTYQWEKSSDNNVWTAISGATDSIYASPALSSSTYFRRRVTSGTGVCEYITPTVYIKVDPVVISSSNTISGSQNLCYGTAANQINGSSPSGGLEPVTYRWISAPDGTSDWSDVPNSNSRNLNPGVLSETTMFKRIVTSTGACKTDTSSGVVRIFIDPELSAGAITQVEDLCQGTNISIEATPATGGTEPYSYQWQRSFNGTSWSNLSGETNQNISGATFNNTSSFRRIVRSAVCRDTTEIMSVTVNTPISSSSNTISENQKLCFGTEASEIVGSTPTGGVEPITYQWISSTDSLNWYSMKDSIRKDLAPGILEETTWFRRIITSSGACNNDTSTTVVKIFIDPTVTAGVIEEHQDLCLGTEITFNTLPAQGGTTPYSYQWQRSTDNQTWINLEGENEEQLSEIIPESSAWYRRIVDSEVCSDTTLSTSVVIDNPIEYGSNTISGNQDLCYGTETEEITGSTPVGGLEPTTYQWLYSTDNASWQIMQDSVRKDLAPGMLEQTTWFKRTITSTGACANDTSESTVRIFIDPALSAGVIEEHQDLCLGTEITFTTLPAEGGTTPYSYQWQRSTDNQTWINLEGENEEQLSAIIPESSAWYRRIVNSEVCSDTTLSTSVVVDKPIESGSNNISGNQDLCYGSETAEITGSTPVGGLKPTTYQWLYSTDNENWQIMQDSLRKDLAPGILEQTTWFKRTITSTGACANDTSESTVKIFIDPALSAGVTEEHQDLCLGTEITFNTLPAQGGTTPYTYQWQRSTDNQIWIDLEGENEEQLSTITPESSAWYRRIVDSEVCSDTTLSTFVVVDNPIETGSNTISGNQYLCFGTESEEITGSTPVGGLEPTTYQWLYSTDNENWQIMQDSMRKDLAPGLLEQTTWFKRTITSTGACANDTSESTVRIFIDPALSAGNIEAHEDVCQGTEVTLTTLEPQGGTTPYVYQWQHSTNNTTWSDLNGENQEQLSPFNAQASGFYRRIVVSEVCSDTTAAVQVQVDIPVDPSTNSIGSGSQICLGSEAPVIVGTAPSGGFTEVSYQWLSSSNGNTWIEIPDANGRDYEPGAIKNTTWYRRVVTSTGACKMDSSEATASVFVDTPVQAGAIGDDQQWCDEDMLFIESKEAATGGTSLGYRWQVTTTLNPEETVWTTIDYIHTAHLNIHKDSLPAASQYYFRRIAYSQVCSATSDTSGVFPCLTPSLTNLRDTICMMQTARDSIVIHKDFSRNGGGLVIREEPALAPISGTLTIDSINNSYTYVPNSGFFGRDTVGITICDTSQFNQCDIKYIYLAVLDTNRTPIVANNHYNVFRNNTLEGNVLRNDIDPDEDTLFVQREILQYPANGTFSIDTSGNFYYDPYYNYVGKDSIVVSVCDYSLIRRCNPSLCKNDTIYINVRPNLVFIPDGFSPNNDGNHDYFHINTDVPSHISITVYNRWGNVVYENNDYKNDWNGEANQGVVIGKGLPDGTYYVRYNINDGEHEGFKYITINR